MNDISSPNNYVLFYSNDIYNGIVKKLYNITINYIVFHIKLIFPDGANQIIKIIQKFKIINNNKFCFIIIIFPNYFLWI